MIIVAKGLKRYRENPWPYHRAELLSTKVHSSEGDYAAVTFTIRIDTGSGYPRQTDIIQRMSISEAQNYRPGIPVWVRVCPEPRQQHKIHDLTREEPLPSPPTPGRSP
ncbi:MAG: hypothetical protein KC431_01240 [Myxococcales bacterium]|nr:hypothetical protein [Myxococcales bacterium]